MPNVQCHLRLLLKSTTLAVTQTKNLTDEGKTRAFNKKYQNERVIKAFLRHQDMNLFLQRNCIEVPALSVPINENELRHKVYYADVAVGSSFFCERERALTSDLPSKFASFLVLSGKKRSTGKYSPKRGPIRQERRYENDEIERNSNFRYIDPERRERDTRYENERSYAASAHREDYSFKSSGSRKGERSEISQRTYIDGSPLSAYEHPLSTKQSRSSAHPRRLYISDGQEVSGEKTGKAVYKLVPDRSEPGVQAIFYPPEVAKSGYSTEYDTRNRRGYGSRQSDAYEDSLQKNEYENSGDYRSIEEKDYSIIGQNTLLDTAPISFDDLFYILKDPSRINLLQEVHFDYDRGLENGKGCCERCSQHPAILYCLAERASLCTYCDEAIHFDEYTKRHAIYYYDQTVKKHFLLCEDHPANVADLFCDICMAVICAECKVNGSHSDRPNDTHKLIKFSDACETLSQKLTDLEKNIENVYNSVGGQMNECLKEERAYQQMVAAVRNKIETEYRCALKDLQGIVERKYGVMNAVVLEKRIAMERCARIRMYTKEIDQAQQVRDYPAITEQKECLKDNSTKIDRNKDDIVLKGFLSVFCEEDGENMGAKKEEYVDISRKIS